MLFTEFKVKRNNKIGEISRIAKEWSLEFKIKPGSVKRGDWSNILKFTETERECCWRGEAFVLLIVVKSAFV